MVLYVLYLNYLSSILIYMEYHQYLSIFHNLGWVNCAGDGEKE